MFIDKNLAQPYDNTLTYSVGNVVIYDKKMYQCIEAIDTEEGFDSSKWKQIYLMNLLNNIGSKLEILALTAFGNGSAEYTEYPSEYFSITTKTNQTITLTCIKAVTGKVIGMCSNNYATGYTFTLKHNDTSLSSVIVSTTTDTYYFDTNGNKVDFAVGDTLTMTASTANNRNDFHIFIYKEDVNLVNDTAGIQYTACLNVWGGALVGAIVNDNFISDYSSNNIDTQFTINVTGTLKIQLAYRKVTDTDTTGAGTVYVNGTSVETFTGIGENAAPQSQESIKTFSLNVNEGDIIKITFSSSSANSNNKVFLLTM